MPERCQHDRCNKPVYEGHLCNDHAADQFDRVWEWSSEMAVGLPAPPHIHDDRHGAIAHT